MIIMRDPGIITLGYILDIEILKWLCGVSVSGRGEARLCVCVCAADWLFGSAVHRD